MTHKIASGKRGPKRYFLKTKLYAVGEMLKEHIACTFCTEPDLLHIHSLNSDVLEEGVQLFIHPEGHDLPGRIPGYARFGKRTGIKG